MLGKKSKKNSSGETFKQSFGGIECLSLKPWGMMVHKNGSGWFNHNLSDLVVDSLASPGQIACLTMSNPAGASRSFIFPCGGGLVPGKTGLQKWRK